MYTSRGAVDDEDERRRDSNLDAVGFMKEITWVKIGFIHTRLAPVIFKPRCASENVGSGKFSETTSTTTKQVLQV